MIFEFSIKNFRSIKDTTVFSLVAEPSKANSASIHVHSLPNNDYVRLLNSAVIYGANGSGKSNVLRAFFNLLNFIRNNNSKAGQEIIFYDPFLFSVECENSPVELVVSFLGPENIKYYYRVEFTRRDVLHEELTYFPKGKETLLFKRVQSTEADNLTHIGKLGNSLGSKEFKVFHNRLLLSKFGEEDATEELLTKVFVHFNNYEVINSHSHLNRPTLKNQINQLFYDDKQFSDKLVSLVKQADLKINRIEIQENSEKDYQHEEGISENSGRLFVRDKSKHNLFGIHDLYDSDRKIGERAISFKEESKGTNTLYILGGRILSTLKTGGTLFIDELETSFHPELSRMLVELFHSEVSNPQGAQLIFTTHDITLLSKSLFRKDQVWFTEKDETGKTDLFSIQDFKEAREDTPFDRWYMAGKFGAIPFITTLGDTSKKNSDEK